MCLSFCLLRCKNTPQNSFYSLSQPCSNMIKEVRSKEGARLFLTQLLDVFVSLHFGLALELTAFFLNGGARLLIILIYEGSTDKVN